MKTKAEQIEEYLKGLEKSSNLNVDLLCHVDCEEVENFDDIRNAIDDRNGFEQEVIYYSNAIEYLQENDASLNKSLAIAAEMGFTLENLNSEVLASLLKTQNEREKFEELESEVQMFLNNVEDIHTCEVCLTEHNEEEDADSCCIE